MKIALITDTHLAATAPDFVANCAAAIAWINASGVELVIHLGDITADGIEAPEQIEDARAVLTALRPPLLCVPGNHDIGDNPVPGLASGHKPFDPAMLARYHAAFGADFWVHEAGGWTLIGLNALLFGTGTDEERGQMAWLGELLDAVAGPIGLLLHKPWFRETLDDSEVHARYVPIAVRRALSAMFDDRDLRFVASGHTHQFRTHRADGVDHIWVPSTAFIVPDAMQPWIGTKKVGLGLLTLGPDRHDFEVIEAPGMRCFDLGDYADLFPKVRAALDGAAA
jgi:3',5'-cyclic AMP phosphodiesterase CpdA